MLGWALKVDVTNGCGDTKDVIATAVDKKGASTQYNGTNYLTINLPATALPVNLTVSTSQNPEDVMTIVYNDVQALKYQLGSGSTGMSSWSLTSTLILTHVCRAHHSAVKHIHLTLVVRFRLVEA